MARNEHTAGSGNLIALRHGAESESILALSSPQTGREIVEAIQGSGKLPGPSRQIGPGRPRVARRREAK